MPRRDGRASPARRACRALTRAYGLREIGTGIGILTSKDPSPWLWGRVAGDALDVATVGAGLVTQRRPLRTLTSLAMLVGVAYRHEGRRRRRRRRGSARSQRLRDYSDRSGFPSPRPRCAASRRSRARGWDGRKDLPRR